MELAHPMQLTSSACVGSQGIQTSIILQVHYRTKDAVIAYITTTKIDKGELYTCSSYIDISHVDITKHAFLKGYVLFPFVG